MGLLDSLASTLLDVYVRQPALMKEQQSLQDRQLQEQLLSQSALQGRMPQNVNIPNFDPSVLSTLSNISNTVAQQRQQISSQIDQMVQSKVMPQEVGAFIKLGLNSNQPDLFSGALNSFLGYKGRTESANTMAGAEVQSAIIRGKSREKAAGIEAGAQKYSADVTAASRRYTADTESKTQMNVAGIQAKTQEDIARMKIAGKMKQAREQTSKSLFENFNKIVKFSSSNSNSAQLPALLEGHNQAAANAAVNLGGDIGFALENSTYNVPNVGLSFGFKSAVRDAIANNLGSRIPPNLRKVYAEAMGKLDTDPGAALEKLYRSGLLDNESFQAILDQLKKNMEYYQNAQASVR